MIMLPCHCGGLPYIGQIPYRDDLNYAVYCMVCGENGGVEWSDNEAISEWNKKQINLKKA